MSVGSSAYVFTTAPARVGLDRREVAARGADHVLDAGDDVGPRRLHAVLEVEHRRVGALAVGAPARAC